MFSKVSSRIGATAAAGLLAVTLGLGIGGGSPAHALPIDDGTGAASCTYAGLSYSEGSVIKMEDGLTYKCSSDGSWVRARVKPPTGLPGAFQSGNFLQRAQ
jgi:hypothetical protein